MCGFKKQKKALTFYSQSLICHCNALVLLSFIILPYKTSALAPGFFRLNKQAQNTERCKYHHHNEFRSTTTPKISNTTPEIKKRTPPSTGFGG